MSVTTLRLPETEMAKLGALREVMHRTRNTVVPFAGSGLSSPALMSWWALLDGLATELSVRDATLAAEVREMMLKDKLIEAAAAIAHGLGRSRVTACIGDAYRQPQAPAAPTYDNLVRLPTDHFVTTNYDPWLKDALARRLQKSVHVARPLERATFGDHVRPDASPWVLMLHGDADAPGTEVLTAGEYRTLLHDSGFHASMQALVATRRFLFVGYSLSDPDVTYVLEAWRHHARSPAAPPDHWLLGADLTPWRVQSLLGLGVQAIEDGAGGDHSQLPAVLAWLAEAPGRAPEIGGMSGGPSPRGAARKGPGQMGSPGGSPAADAPQGVAASRGAPQSGHGASRAARDAGEAALRARLHDRTADRAEVYREIREHRRRNPAPDPLALGTPLGGRFTIGEPIDSGTFGQVFRAWDAEQGIDVAIKVLHRHCAADPDRRARFDRGAEQMARLSHPGIARVFVHDGHEPDGDHRYLAMELATRGDLERAIRGESSPLEARLGWLAQVASALAHAHGRHVFHRDVKPANVLLTDDDRALLTDFDLVSALDSYAGSRTAMAIGTPIYAAPEIPDLPTTLDPVRDAGALARIDVYSLGMTLLFALHGKGLRAKHASGLERAALIGTLDVSPALRDLLRASTAEEPGERTPSAAAFLAALRAASAATATPLATPPAPVQSATGAPRVAPKPPAPSAPQRIAPSGAASAVHGTPGLAATALRPALVAIPAGSFTMGSPSGVGHDDERPAHRVTLTRSFLMAATQVTQAQYAALMGKNPSHFTKGEEASSRPVEQVSWHDAVAYCDELSRRENLRPAYAKDGAFDPMSDGYRLPTEAQWEYACRAGTTTRWSHGDDEGGLVRHAWYGEGESGTTHPVATRRPNPWGLFDMHGNVWEWCHDGQRAYTAAACSDPVGGGPGRVVRGGSYWDVAGGARSACRFTRDPESRRLSLGFRPVRPAPLERGV